MSSRSEMKPLGGTWLYCRIPFFLGNSRKNRWLVLISSLFVTVFFSMHTQLVSIDYTVENIFWGLLCFGCLYFNLIIVPRFFPLLIHADHWTLGKQVLFLGWLLCFTIVLFSVINYLFFFNLYGSKEVLYDYKEVTLVLFFPLLQATLLYGLFPQSENIRSSKDLDSNFLNPSSKNFDLITQSKGTPEHSCIELKIEAGNRSIFLVREHLLYVQSEENYFVIVSQINKAVKKTMLRGTLKEVEKQLANIEHLYRCHRSYIADLTKVSQISGSAKGYKLHFDGVEEVVPVSRSKSKTLIKAMDKIPI